MGKMIETGAAGDVLGAMPATRSRDVVMVGIAPCFMGADRWPAPEQMQGSDGPNERFLTASAHDMVI